MTTTSAHNPKHQTITVSVDEIVDYSNKEGGVNNNQKSDVPINVIARVRPQIPNELRHPVCIEVIEDSVVNGHKTQIVVRGSLKQNEQKKVYSFEKVLDPESTQS